MTFLGRQELIPYGKKRIYARRLSGTRIYVGVHQKGLFQPYWSEKDEQAQTPGQRQKNAGGSRRGNSGVLKPAWRQPAAASA